MRIAKFWVLKPFDAFGNRAEDLYYGAMKCRREGLRLIILKRKWNLAGKVAFRAANLSLLRLKHPLIVNNPAIAMLDVLLSVWWSACRIAGIAWRKLQALSGFGVRQNFLVRWSEVEIGRDGLWGGIEPPFSAAQQTIDWGRDHRQPLGLRFGPRTRLEVDFPELVERPFICLHVRTGGFFNDHAYSAPRNASIENYFLAIDELVTRGYVVVRIGDPGMPPLQREGVLDYTHHSQRNEDNDVLLVEHCDAYIGSLTGPIDLACLFEKRIFTVNTLSLSHCTWYRKGSLFIPKRVKLDSRLLSLKEQVDRHLFDVMGTGHMNPGAEYIENSADEIHQALLEFLGAPPLTDQQKVFNDYLKARLVEYFEGDQLWASPKVDKAQKIRWLARQHTVDGGVAQCWLEKNWENSEV